ncbi:YciI family protein [Marinoscillum pacificum]|uniref:YciI family protein n=1 Tax=Marinoscillum pacificum TaxID=392723 RepID=UPI0021582D9F|nr:YciI family protein [Marinoscillum pacificum]|tara:strand:+ start:1006 stop:1347 length:342 start_codon:yes stop_codon:yes gene_type:complete
MKQFLYLFRGGDEGYAQLSPEEMQNHMAKWNEWMIQISKTDEPVPGLPLNNEGKVVEKGGEIITDGPYPEGKEIVGGYVIVEANTLDEAVELSKGCPIFDFGGIVEVREAVDM